MIVRSIRKSLWRPAVALLAVIPLAIAACGSSGNPVTQATTAKLYNPTNVDQLITTTLGALPTLTGETTRGINGKVITLGGTGTNTKAGQNTLPGLSDGAKARIEEANRAGGVAGFTFNYVGFQDDQGQPGLSQQAVRDLVENKKVFALVPFVPASGVAAPYLNSNSVPYFGWLGQDYCGWKDIPYAFGVFGETSCAAPLPGGQAIGYTGSFEAYMKVTGKKVADIKVAIYSTSDPYAIASVTATKVAAKALGFKVVSVQTDLPSATQPPLSDYTPVATKIIQSGANLVLAATSVPAILGVTGALKSNGYTGDESVGFAAQAVLASPTTAQVMDGLYATVNYGNPGFGATTVTRVSDALKAIGSSAPVDGIGTMTGYWSADLFLQALQKVTGPLTAQKIANVLNSGGFTYQGIPGITCSGPWPALRVVSTPCIGVLQYDARSKKLVTKMAITQLGSYAIGS
jgi:ABC-type branched-subunit amino acid transport system substrate-binding protein